VPKLSNSAATVIGWLLLFMSGQIVQIINQIMSVYTLDNTVPAVTD
jgi:hypothetical protein